MSGLLNKWKDAIKTVSKPDSVIPNINSIRSQLDTTWESLNLPERIKQLEEWQNKFADPKIRENIANLEARYNDIVNIYNKMTKTANALADEADRMLKPVKNIIAYISYLETDLAEIKEALRIGWWKLPDPIAAAIHVGEAIYHLIVINSNMKGVLTGLKDRLFPSMKKNLT